MTRYVNKRHLTIGLIIILMILYAWRLWDIRSRFPKKRIEECTIGESIDYNPRIQNLIDAKTKFKPVGYAVYKGEEFLKAYPQMKSTYQNYKDFGSFYVIVPELEITNTGEDKISITKLLLYVTFSSPFNGYQNGVRILDSGDIEAGESKTVGLVVVVNPYVIGIPKIEKFMKSKFYIRLTSYPVEKRLIYEKE